MTTAAPIQPLQSARSGRYEDHLVVVEPGTRPGITAGLRSDGRFGLRWRLPPAELDDELAGPLADALAPHTDDHEVFIRAFTGVVLTARPRATAAWELFYRNSLSRIRHPSRPGYAEVYRHALELLPPTIVADVGCGFGFLALHLAARGTLVTACDHHSGTVDLLRRMAGRLGLRLGTVAGDGRALPLPDGSVDAVALLHVLEHVDELSAARLLAEAARVARRRVVVAVPYETSPTRLFGHVRTIGPDHLAGLGARSGLAYRCHEHHGGWLVLDRTLLDAMSAATGGKSLPLGRPLLH
jgi:SAM-dependent methyltransferase